MNTARTTRRGHPRFRPRQRDIATFTKALAHPARLAILEFLAGHQGCMCGQIVNQLPLAQSTVSQHLRELKDAGLIQGAVEGVKVCYCLNPAAIRRMRQALDGFLDGLDGLDVAHAAPNDRCEC